jgi:hypothetical protein
MNSNIYYQLVSKGVQVLSVNVKDQLLDSRNIGQLGSITLDDEKVINNSQAERVYSIQHEGQPIESSAVAVFISNSSFESNSNQLMKLNKAALFMSDSRITTNASNSNMPLNLTAFDDQYVSLLTQNREESISKLMKSRSSSEYIYNASSINQEHTLIELTRSFIDTSVYSLERFPIANSS